MKYSKQALPCQEIQEIQANSDWVVGTPQSERRREQIKSNESRGSELSPALRAVIKVPPVELWGEFLRRFDWDWFITLTFRGVIGEWGAERRFRKLVRQMRYDAGHRVEWFRVTEWHKFRNVPHYHALMLNCGGLRRLRYVDWWWGQGFGIARIVKYDERLGAGYYLGKYLMKRDSDISVSRGLKRYTADISDDSQGVSLMSLLTDNTNQDTLISSRVLA